MGSQMGKLYHSRERKKKQKTSVKPPPPTDYSRYVGKSDSITISVWNHKKIHKKQGAGFLGCVRLLSNAISRLKDTGCKHIFIAKCFPAWLGQYFASLF